jgi:coenzyme F420-0:L-glutamate ligase/coenzyme F420-1:gamma-L-glutamate ligase
MQLPPFLAAILVVFYDGYGIIRKTRKLMGEKMTYPEIKIFGVTGIAEIKTGDDLGELILNACEKQGTPLKNDDVLVVTQKIVSKAEDCLIDLNTVIPSSFAMELATQWSKDPRQVEIILQESRRIVRMDHGVIICETKHGLFCANAGVDASNLPGENIVSTLPKNPDYSASLIREKILKRLNVEVAVIISDTFGRPWRAGTTNVAIGIAGLSPLKDFRGEIDPYGFTIKVTQSAVADEIAGASGLVSEKMNGIPVSVVRGVSYSTQSDGIKTLFRDPQTDFFH